MITFADIQLEEIFEHAAALPTMERAGYLDAACEGHPEWRAEIESLLLALVAGGNARESGVWTPECAAELARGQAEQAGGRIGAYRLVEQIGEGGFGTVWLAEQERPVRRQVALKIIKLGMDTKEVIARFEHERQALAIMEHPGIAKVFDAGATQTGRPFFVMELVRGIRLTEYCDAHRLATAERLRLFIAVCEAVQHAHQKGIIHRDLKPSNILVALEDGAAVPKVIDFGVAKATGGQRLTDLSLHTRTEAMLGTPLYMSPEQAAMGGADIDARTDIYSLGVVLYELLAGRTPFEPTGLEEMRRLIREVEPPRPSVALQGQKGREGREGLAAEAGLFRPSRPFSAELDWIAMKALEKDRTRRYETASELAMDLQRHLHHEPVLARPASAAYRFQKIVRRNRLAFAASATIAALLAIGIAVSVWQAKRAVAVRTDLRGTAPIFMAQARALFAEQKPDEALEKVGFALRLVPDDAGVHLRHAHMLEALGRLPEASAAYRGVLALRPGDASAVANLALCEQLVPAPGGAALSGAARATLLEAVKAERRNEDLWPLLRATGRESEAMKALLEVRLKPLMALPGWETPANQPRFADNGDGTFTVDLSKLPVSDFSMLAGLPVSFLNLEGCPVSDLSPLTGLPLHTLHIARTQVSDLRPLANSPLETLDIRFCPIEDLRPLRGRPLTFLEMSGTKVRDLAPLQGTPLKVLCAGSSIETLDALAGMPLAILRISSAQVRDITVLGTLPIEELDLSDCPEIADLSPLLKCAKLERLVIPGNCRDLESVRRLPKLKQLADVSLANFQWSWASVPSAETTLRAIDERRALQARLELLRAALRKAGASESQLAKASFSADGTLDLDLSGLPISDLHFLEGLPVRRLSITGTKVSDLSALCGAPLIWLQAHQCPIRDITPLAGCSALSILGLAETQVTDLRPVLGCPLLSLHIEGSGAIRDLAVLARCVTLEDLLVPRNVRGLEALRTLPRLRRISYDWDAREGKVAQSAAEFWAEFDRNRNP